MTSQMKAILTLSILVALLILVAWGNTQFIVSPPLGGVVSKTTVDTGLLDSNALEYDISPFRIRGPLPWSNLSKQLRDMYTLNGTVEKADWYFYMEITDIPDPIDYSNTGGGPLVWTKAYLEELKEKASRRATEGLALYGREANEDMYAAFDAHSPKGKIVLVIGTIIPWIEVRFVSTLSSSVYLYDALE